MAVFLLTTSLGQWIRDADRQLFLGVNRGMANPFFDAVLPFLRDSVLWAPLYLFLVAFALVNFGLRGLWWALLFLGTVALADLLGTYALKETIQRIRPCNDAVLAGHVRLVLQYCPGGYSFVSNHAANHFGLATFLFLTLRPVAREWVWFAYLWAALISFAQVYVGAHYPLDVMAGALLGFAAGNVTASVYRANFGALSPLT